MRGTDDSMELIFGETQKLNPGGLYLKTLKNLKNTVTKESLH